jgi:hypothetical protein
VDEYLDRGASKVDKSPPKISKDREHLQREAPLKISKDREHLQREAPIKISKDREHLQREAPLRRSKDASELDISRKDVSAFCCVRRGDTSASGSQEGLTKVCKGYRVTPVKVSQEGLTNVSSRDELERGKNTSPERYGSTKVSQKDLTNAKLAGQA